MVYAICFIQRRCFISHLDVFGFVIGNFIFQNSHNKHFLIIFSFSGQYFVFFFVESLMVLLMLIALYSIYGVFVVGLIRHRWKSLKQEKSSRKNQTHFSRCWLTYASLLTCFSGHFGLSTGAPLPPPSSSSSSSLTRSPCSTRYSWNSRN